MSSCWMKAFALATGILGLAPAAALAMFDPTAPGAAAKICVPSTASPGRYIVDKQKLADQILKDAKFSVGAYTKLQDQVYANLGPSLQIVASAATNPGVCKTEASGCQSDSSTIGDISNTVHALLQYTQGYAPPHVPQAVYFQDHTERSAIVCTALSAAPPSPPPPAGKSSAAKDDTANKSPLDGLRIRGSVDDLFIDRKQQGFKGASKATINFNSDGVAKTRTDTMTMVVGYGFGDPSSIAVIPYVGTNRKIVTVQPGSKSKPSSAETVNGGLQTSMYFDLSAGDRLIGNRFNIRPDFLEDLQDNSEILSLQLQYLPEVSADTRDPVPFWLNFFAPLIAGDSDPVWVSPMLDFRVDTGTYANRGNMSVAAQHRDFVRVGGRAGLTIILPSWFPVTLTTSYTGLYGARGGVNIGYFANSVSYPVIKDYVSITASYTNGNTEDTAKREQLWLVGLSLKY